MIATIDIKTRSRTEMRDVTDMIQGALREAGAREGICTAFVMHTTAGVTINENADPDVPRDILAGLEKLAPPDGRYRHAEENSDAHIKTSLVGPSVTMIVQNGSLLLGTWQSVFFCEFDGPRSRKLYVKHIEG